MTMYANEFEPKGKQKLTELFEGRSSQLYTKLMQLRKKIQILKKIFFRLSFRNCIIFLQLILHSAVHIYDFHILMISKIPEIKTN